MHILTCNPWFLGTSILIFGRLNWLTKVQRRHIYQLVDREGAEPGIHLRNCHRHHWCRQPNLWLIEHLDIL
jgi:hypothetical protein